MNQKGISSVYIVLVTVAVTLILFDIMYFFELNHSTQVQPSPSDTNFSKPNTEEFSQEAGTLKDGVGYDPHTYPIRLYENSDFGFSFIYQKGEVIVGTPVNEELLHLSLGTLGGGQDWTLLVVPHDTDGAMEYAIKVANIPSQYDKIYEETQVDNKKAIKVIWSLNGNPIGRYVAYIIPVEDENENKTFIIHGSEGRLEPYLPGFEFFL